MSVSMSRSLFRPDFPPRSGCVYSEPGRQEGQTDGVARAGVWPQGVGMRDRLIHAYDQIDLQILGDTITDDLPPLIAELENILDQ